MMTERPPYHHLCKPGESVDDYLDLYRLEYPDARLSFWRRPPAGSIVLATIKVRVGDPESCIYRPAPSTEG